MAGQLITNMPMNEYQAAGALSASGAWTLIQECPALYWYQSPWNPAFKQENSLEFDLGAATHLAALEPDTLERRVAIIDAADYKTTAAREAKQWAYNEGLVPLLPKHLAQVRKLAEALRADPWVADLLDGAAVETSLFWDVDGTPCKARPDLITRDRAVLADLKTCASASPRDFQRYAFNYGYFLRAVWYIDGYQETTGERVSDYWFIVIAKDPPHLISVMRLGPRAIEWGRIAARRSLSLFRKCWRANQWPSYCEEPTTLELPTWAEYQLTERDQMGEFTREDIRRSVEWLSPSRGDL